MTSYPEVDFVLLSVDATPVELPQVPFLTRCTCPLLLCGADGQTVQKTVVMPQLQLFVVKVLKTVEVPQCSSSTPVALHVTRVACWREPVEIPQVQFWDKVFTPVVAVCCRWPDSAGNCGDAAVSVFEQVDGRPCDLTATSSGDGDFWRPRRLTVVHN